MSRSGGVDAPDTAGAGAERPGRQADARPQPRRALPPLLDAGAGSGAGRALLLRDLAPEERLLRLGDGDPLALFARGSARLRESALLVDTTRLFTESLLQCASVPFTSSTEIDGFVTARIDDAIRICLRRDRAALREGVLLGRGEHEFLEDTLGVENGLVAAVGFNALSERDRRIAFALLFEGQRLEELLDTGVGSIESIRRGLRRALDALLKGTPEEA